MTHVNKFNKKCLAKVALSEIKFLFSPALIAYLVTNLFVYTAVPLRHRIRVKPELGVMQSHLRCENLTQSYTVQKHNLIL